VPRLAPRSRGRLRSRCHSRDASYLYPLGSGWVVNGDGAFYRSPWTNQIAVSSAARAQG
jgi:hypothetical protein